MLGARLYDRIGAGYPATRRTEPRIAARIDAALGSATTVVNVGAGTGNYEPSGRRVTAVEPSAVMIDQRPPGAGPAVQAAAQSLPFADASFDAAMAVWTVHHWADASAGLAELHRVARDRVVVATWDPAFQGEFWLTDRYLPEIRQVDPPPSRRSRSSPPPSAAASKSRHCRSRAIAPTAFWERSGRGPRPTSTLRCAPGCPTLAVATEAVSAGLTSLAADLDSGEWDARYGDLRAMEMLDLGYRLVTATRW